MTTLRAARPTDAGAVGGILTEFAQTTPWMPKLHTGAEDIAHAGKLIDRGWVRVAEQNDKVVGFMSRDGQEIDALYVGAKHRDAGIGEMLLEDARLEASVLELWTFQANTGAQRFYERNGFREIKRTEGTRNDEGLPDIKYGWRRKVVG